MNSLMLCSLVFAIAFAVGSPEAAERSCEEVMSAKSCRAMDDLTGTIQNSIFNVDDIVSKAVVKGTNKVTDLYSKLIKMLPKRVIENIRNGKLDQAAIEKRLVQKRKQFRELLDKSIKEILASFNSTNKALHNVFTKAIMRGTFKKEALKAAVKKLIEKVTGDKDDDDSMKAELASKFRRSAGDHFKSILNAIHAKAKTAIKSLLAVVKTCLGSARNFVEKTLNELGDGSEGDASAANALADADAEDEIEQVTTEAEELVESTIGLAVTETEAEVEDITSSLEHEVMRRDLADDIIIHKLKFFLQIFASIAGPDLGRVANDLIMNNRAEVVAAVKGGFFTMLRIILPMVG